MKTITVNNQTATITQTGKNDFLVTLPKNPSKELKNLALGTIQPMILTSQIFNIKFQNYEIKKSMNPVSIAKSYFKKIMFKLGV
jgi:hypothetical protein